MVGGYFKKSIRDEEDLRRTIRPASGEIGFTIQPWTFSRTIRPASGEIGFTIQPWTFTVGLVCCRSTFNRKVLAIFFIFEFRLGKLKKY
jgi:hypothetical protein